MLRSRPIKYEADALHMSGELFYDEAAKSLRPGVLVFPEGNGLSPYVKSRASQLAQLGYAALACDLHGNGAVHNDVAEMSRLLMPLFDDPSRIRARSTAALNALMTSSEVEPTKIAAIGYCFGGTMALELARSGANILAAAGFHSGVKTKQPDDARNIRCKILVCLGAKDVVVPAEERAAFEREMSAGNVDWPMHIFGRAAHSFTNPNVAELKLEYARYDRISDVRSWSLLMQLLDEVF